SEGATREELATCRKRLAQQFEAALRLIFQSLPSPEPAITPWHPHREGNPSVWFSTDHRFPINEPDHGAGFKTTPEGPTSYVRFIASSWTGSDDLDLHDTLLWSGGGYSWGQTTEG